MDETMITERGTEWVRIEHVALGDRGECWIRADESATWLAWAETAHRPELVVAGRVVREAEPLPDDWWAGMVPTGDSAALDFTPVLTSGDTREGAIEFLDRAIPLVLSGRQAEVYAATDEDWQEEVELMARAADELEGGAEAGR